MGRKREGTGMVRVRVLGAVELSIGSRRIGMNTEVLFALALYLTTRAGERVARDQLLDLLWTRGRDEQRRHALRQMMYRLRQKGLVLDEDGEYLSIARARVQSDLREVIDSGWPERASAAEIDAAATFSPVFSRRMAPGFVEWLDEVRERAVSQHRKASLRQIIVARREGRWADLERWAQSVLRSDPLNEEATLARAESAAMAGSKTVALEILDTYLAELGDISEELGKPALALRKRLAERRADWTVRGPKEVALVGRTELMSRLTGLVDAAWRGEGSAVMLVGAPGIGKTRLAMEALGYAELKGMRTVVVRAEAGQRERPLALLLHLASSLIEQPGAAGSAPEAIKLITRLSHAPLGERPEIVATFDSLKPALVECIEDVIRAIAAERRLLIVLDDLHHADHYSHVILDSLTVRLASSRICWIGTNRERRPTQAGATLAPAAWSRAIVPPLVSTESAALANAVVAAHRYNLGELAVESIATTSGGNPLFVRQLAVHRASSATPDRLPETLADLMRDRLGRLPDEFLLVLRVVAVLGSCASVGRLNRVSGMPPSVMVSTIELLESEGLLALDTRGLRLHETWQQVVIESMGPATRSSVSLECANALCDEDPDSLSLTERWRAAELFSCAGDSRRSGDLFLMAADAMLHQGLPDEAASVLEPLLGSVHHPNKLVAVQRRLAEAHLARGDLDGVLRSTSQLIATTRIEPGTQAATDLAVALCHRTEALAKSHRPYIQEIGKLQDFARDPRLPALARRLACYTGIRRTLNEGNHDLARLFHQHSEEVGEDDFSGVAWLVRLIFAAELGSADTVVRADHALDNLREQLGSLTLEASTLRFRSYALRMAGEYARAIVVGDEAYATSVAYRQLESAGSAAEMMVFLHLDLEDTSAAAAWLARCAEFSKNRAHPMREKGLRHASIRLALQSGDARRAWNEAAPLLEASLNTPVLSQRAGEVLTAAVAALACRDRDSASRLADSIVPDLQRAPAAFLLDYPSELGTRLIRALGGDEPADEFARAYINKRRATFARPLPPFCLELRKASML